MYILLENIIIWFIYSLGAPNIYGTNTQSTHPKRSASLPGKLMRGDNGDRPERFSRSCRPAGACMGLKMVILRFGGANRPPDNVSCVRMPADCDDVFISMVSADLEIKIEEDCCRPSLLVDNFVIPASAVNSAVAVSSICVEALRIHLSGRWPPNEPLMGCAVASECAEVERTNCRTCFWWAVRKLPLFELIGWPVVSGCCKKLLKFVFVDEDEVVEAIFCI